MMEGETPTSMMLNFKEKGNESVKLGQTNKAKNVQYYRDAINHYLEAIGWSEKVKCSDDPEKGEGEGDVAADRDDESPAARSFTRSDLSKVQSILYSNKSMAHTFIKVRINNIGGILLEFECFDADTSHFAERFRHSTSNSSLRSSLGLIQNWGFVIADASKAVELDSSNVKGWYRLAKAREARREWALCDEACEGGLRSGPEHKLLKKLQGQVAKKALKEREAMQRKERERVKRQGEIKAVWKWCKAKVRTCEIATYEVVFSDEEHCD